MNGDKVFVDTNIIVYAYDMDAGKKYQIASKLVKDLWHSGLGVLSTQVLQEFFVTVTNKISSPLDIVKATGIVKNLSKWNVIVNDVNILLAAIEIHEEHKFSFWDSMIIAAAIKGGAKALLSEDLSDNQEIEGLIIKNPFKILKEVL
ncbi:MAG: PIN domain-containing protein [Nitrospirota bacterium]